ncbi:helix-turn-helix domain-containing protein [Stieleria sedimenti]|uniref:helix-turn-helix domain-containing protein n=1 Tax=Stieleria sedimenti TaxID=2976331 RepID=UPI00389AA4B8
MTKTCNTTETAEILKCSRDQVRSLIPSGRLHGVNISLGSQRARWIVPASAIEDFLAPRVQPPPPLRRKKHRRKQWIT